MEDVHMSGDLKKLFRKIRNNAEDPHANGCRRPSGRRSCLLWSAALPRYWPLSLSREVDGLKGILLNETGLFGCAMVKANDFLTSVFNNSLYFKCRTTLKVLGNLIIFAAICHHEDF